MRQLLPVAFSVLLAACALWPAGEDPKGKELKAQATPVLAALARYFKDKGEYPSSLHELVPRYLPAVPFAVGLRLDRDTKMIAFGYAPSWPQSGRVACTARLGDREWSCQGNP